MPKRKEDPMKKASKQSSAKVVKKPKTQSASKHVKLIETRKVPSAHIWD